MYFIGTDAWGTKEWLNHFYAQVNGKDLLKHYSNTFNFVELKSTYFHYDPEQIKKINGNVENKQFRFCPWIPRNFVYQKDPLLQTSNISEFLSNWDDCSNKLGPAPFSQAEKYTEERKDKLFRLIETLSKSHSYVLNMTDPTWKHPPIRDEVFNHANRHQVGVIMKDSEYFSMIKISFLYLRINTDEYQYIEKILRDIPTQIKDVYICLTGSDKLLLLEKLKELQSIF